MTEAIEKKRKCEQPHWYKMYVGECPACGSNQSYRKRVYGAKPDRMEDCYEFLPDQETYDNCQEGVW